ncbi:unnamed protein product, partial [Allacma fusca]
MGWDLDFLFSDVLYSVIFIPAVTVGLLGLIIVTSSFVHFYIFRAIYYLYGWTWGWQDASAIR